MADSTRTCGLSSNTGVKSLTLILLVSLTATSCMFHKPPQPPGAFPDQARRALDAKYPGWQLANFSGACTAAAGSSPTQVNDDFNTDGFGDWGLEIHTADAIKVVVVMGWLADFRVYELESAPGDKADRYLAKAGRGTKYINPVTKSDDYLNHNSMVSVSCSGDRFFYTWDGDGFRKIVPGAPTTTKPARR